MQTVWGVDLGVRKAHFFGIAQNTQSLRKPFTFHYEVSAVDVRTTELHNLAALIRRDFSNPDVYGRSVFFIEEPVLAGPKNMRTFMHIAQTAGAVASVLTPAYFIPVATWKKNTVGKGNAKKSDVASWLFERYPSYAAACGGTEDQKKHPAGFQDYADAACLAIYGNRMLGIDLFGN